MRMPYRNTYIRRLKSLSPCGPPVVSAAAIATLQRTCCTTSSASADWTPLRAQTLKTQRLSSSATLSKSSGQLNGSVLSIGDAAAGRHYDRKAGNGPFYSPDRPVASNPLRIAVMPRDYEVGTGVPILARPILKGGRGNGREPSAT